MSRGNRRRVALLFGLTAGLAARPSSGSPPTECSDCQPVTGRLLESGVRIPVTDAVVLVSAAPPGASEGDVDAADAMDEPAWSIRATVSTDGKFETDPAPRGLLRVTVIAPGFDRVDRIVRPGRRSTTLFMRRSEDDAGYRTIVQTKEVETAPPPTNADLERIELETVPGSQGDPLRALANLPGVGRAPAGLGLIVLRGNTPQFSRVYVGPHAVPHAFHALSIESILPSAAIERLELVPGNFDAPYGGATGGLVLVETRELDGQGVHGNGRISLGSAGANVRAPVGKKGRVSVGGRRGYADAVLGAVNRFASTQYLLPGYWDYQVLFERPVGRAKVIARALGSSDHIQFRVDDPLSEGTFSAFDFRNDFHRFDVEVRFREGPWKFLLSPVFRLDVNHANTALSQAAAADPGGTATQTRERFDYVTGGRAEASRQFSRGFTLRAGTEVELDWWKGELEDLVIGFAGPGVDVSGTPKGTQHRIGTYLDAQLARGRFWAAPGVRADAFIVDEDHAFGLDPRLRVGVKAADSVDVHAGIGTYSRGTVLMVGSSSGLFDSLVAPTSRLQLPTWFRQQFDPAIGLIPLDSTTTGSPLTSPLRVDTNVQTSAGVTAALEVLEVDVTGFWQRTHPRGSSLGLTENALFRRWETAYGAEVLLRKRARKFYGWLAYTLMWRKRHTSNSELTNDIVPADFDQRHNLVALASYALPRHWRIGGRFRVASGFPLTPLIGATTNGRPVYGATNSDRYPTFHQLDIRVDRQWVLDRAVISAYLDIQNVYGYVYPEVFYYSASLRERVGFGLPIFPALGFDVAF